MAGLAARWLEAHDSPLTGGARVTATLQAAPAGISCCIEIDGAAVDVPAYGLEQELRSYLGMPVVVVPCAE